MPPPAELTSQEQRAICEFAERSKQLSPARAIELAEHASTLSGEQGPRAVRELKRYAAWIQRGRV